MKIDSEKLKYFIEHPKKGIFYTDEINNEQKQCQAIDKNDLLQKIKELEEEK